MIRLKISINYIKNMMLQSLTLVKWFPVEKGDKNNNM